jgi:hypothetical protein
MRDKILSLEEITGRPIDWELSDDAEHPYVATLDDVDYVVRINDFPEESLYTLLCEERELGDFDDWPLSWVRPSRIGM